MQEGEADRHSSASGASPLLASSCAPLLAGCSSKQLPPTYGNVLRMGDTRFAHCARACARVRAQRHLIEPGDWRAGAFADWRIKVEGRVARPGSSSLADPKALPARIQITKRTCDEGWIAIVEWTGAQLRLPVEPQLGYKRASSA